MNLFQNMDGSYVTTENYTQSWIFWIGALGIAHLTLELAENLYKRKKRK